MPPAGDVGRTGEVSWRVRIRMKGHPIQTETFDRKTDASKWAESIRAAIREGRRFQTSEAGEPSKPAPRSHGLR
jgi:hypothetical protein